MAVGRDLVGEAFVRITADTTEMRHAISRAGEEDGKAYGEKFSAEVTKASDGLYRRQRKTLAAAISDPKQFDQLAKGFAKAEDAAADFRNNLETLYKQKQMNKKETERYTAAVNKWEKQAIKAREEAYKLAEADKASAKAKALQAGQIKKFSALYRELEVIERDRDLAIQRQSAAWSTYGKNLLAGQRQQTIVINDQHTMWRRWTRMVDRVVIGTDRADTAFQRIGIGVGRAFGKGSRNNFLNWIGSMVGGMVRLGAAIITFPAKALAHITSSFDAAFSASRAAGAGKLLSSLRGIVGIFGGKGGIIGILVGAAAGSVAFGKVLPGVISLLTQMGGVVSALVGSIGIGLTGALFGLIPAAAGAATGLGGLISVFTSFFMNKNNTKFIDNTFAPFKKMNESYYPEIKAFLTNISKGFKTFIADMTPSLDQFFASFKSRFNDPSTLHSLGLWSDSMGRIATKINDAITAFGSGFVSFFVPVLPYAERLANYIDRIAVKFDRWASSSEGQNAIADFMKDAWTNAKLVWDILGEIGSIIGTVFSSGDKTGSSFLTDIRDKLAEIDAFLKTPEGRSKLDNFFGDVKGIGEDIGNLALNIGEIIKAFNSPEGRANAKAIMDAVVTISEVGIGLAKVADDVGRLVGYLVNPALTAALNLINSIRNGGLPVGENAPKSEGGAIQKSLQGGTIDFGIKTKINGVEIETGGLKKAVSKHLGLTPDQENHLADYVVNTKMNKELYDQTKLIVETYKFTDKKVPISANPAVWEQVKGTVAGYAFEPKVVKIVPHGQEVYDWVAKWNRTSIAAKTARINVGVTRSGGRDLTGGLTLASGGYFDQPTRATIGEAGPEAVVPLNRPLSQVDPAVRALSAIAQGKTSLARGAVVGGGRNINVMPGAIVVQTPLSDPNLVAEAVLDRLVAFA